MRNLHHENEWRENYGKLFLIMLGATCYLVVLSPSSIRSPRIKRFRVKGHPLSGCPGREAPRGKGPRGKARHSSECERDYERERNCERTYDKLRTLLHWFNSLLWLLSIKFIF